MSLTRTGFHLTFTKPIVPEQAANLDNYSLQHFEYEWHAGYGSAPSNKKIVKPVAVELSDDQREVRVTLSEVLPRKVYELNLQGLNAVDGSQLAHRRAFYTLNRLRR